MLWCRKQTPATLIKLCSWSIAMIIVKFEMFYHVVGGRILHHLFCFSLSGSIACGAWFGSSRAMFMIVIHASLLKHVHIHCAPQRYSMCNIYIYTQLPCSVKQVISVYLYFIYIYICSISCMSDVHIKFKYVRYTKFFIHIHIYINMFTFRSCHI